MNKKEKLEELRESCIKETNCPLSKNANNIVFGEGNCDADIMFIGEAPGAKEDITGRPFVGSAGKNLDKFLSHISVRREEIYIANIEKFRPPNNRNPTSNEIKACTPWLIEQIWIIEPKVLCTLGNFSTKYVLADFNVDKMKEIDGISSLHGKIHKVRLDHHEFTVIPLYHPAALIYNRKLIPEMYKDLETVAKIIGKNIVREHEYMQEHTEHEKKERTRKLSEF